jgi:hypothetical protein
MLVVQVDLSCNMHTKIELGICGLICQHCGCVFPLIIEWLEQVLVSHLVLHVDLKWSQCTHELLCYRDVVVVNSIHLNKVGIGNTFTASVFFLIVCMFLPKILASPETFSDLTDVKI